MGDTSPVSLIPANQASLIIPSGGSSGNSLDDINIPLSAGLGGLVRFEYDNLFWSNDFFSITTRNAAVGLLVGYYVPGSGASYCLLPIALPRQSLALPYTDIRSYQEALAYALNLYFAGPKTVYVYAPDGTKAYTEILPVDKHSMPILQTDHEPPLIWKVSHTGQLVLVQNNNPSLDKYMPSEYVFNFNLVKLTSSVTPPGSNSTLDEPYLNGWIGAGKYLYGFGKYDGRGNYVDDITYYDGPNAAYTFTTLCQPSQPFINISGIDEFDAISNRYKLFQSIVSDSSALCIPTKYYVIESRELTRNQLRPMTANIERPTHNIIGIIFTSPFGKNYFSASSPYMFNDAASPSINMIPNQPHNQIDISFTNEFNARITPYDVRDDYSYLRDVEGIFSDPLSAFVPDAYYALNPFLETQPDGWSVFPFYLINDNLFKVKKSPIAQYNANTSTNVVHFSKMIAPN